MHAQPWKRERSLSFWQVTNETPISTVLLTAECATAAAVIPIRTYSVRKYCSFKTTLLICIAIFFFKKKGKVNCFWLNCSLWSFHWNGGHVTRRMRMNEVNQPQTIESSFFSNGNIKSRDMWTESPRWDLIYVSLACTSRSRTGCRSPRSPPVEILSRDWQLARLTVNFKVTQLTVKQLILAS